MSCIISGRYIVSYILIILYYKMHVIFFLLILITNKNNVRMVNLLFCRVNETKQNGRIHPNLSVITNWQEVIDYK